MNKIVFEKRSSNIKNTAQTENKSMFCGNGQLNSEIDTQGLINNMSKGDMIITKKKEKSYV